MISLKPIKPEHAVVIKKQCYDVRQLKKWIDGKDKAGKAPTIPHTNLPITEDRGKRLDLLEHRRRDKNHWQS